MAALHPRSPLPPGVEIRSRIKGRYLDGDELFPASGGACGANPGYQVSASYHYIMGYLFQSDAQP
jgi:hypothetical protein